MRKEYDLALKHGLIVLPIGGTGSISAELANDLLVKDGAVTGARREALKALAKPVSDLIGLIEPIVALVRNLKEGK